MSDADGRCTTSPGLSASREDVEVRCPVCAVEASSGRLCGAEPMTGDRFDVVECDECGLAYVNPFPDAEVLSAYYADGYYGSRHPVMKDFFMSLRTRHIGSATGGGRLLDIGCGAGDFIASAFATGWKATGVEQGQAPILQLGGGETAEVIPPDQLYGLEEESFEVVTLWHVFEHLPEPRRTLEQIKRVLVPGGRLVIEVPNFGSWQARIGGSDWFHLDVPRHLLHFNRASLGRAVVDAGFVTERWSTFSLEYDAFGMAQTLLNKVCLHPNHLFQILIRNPVAKSSRDTAISAALFLPALVVSGLVALVAPIFGQGGVLRMIARKPS